MIETDNPTRRFIRDTQGRQYELTSLLGRGSFGKVYRAESEATGETLAAKLPLSDEDFSGEAGDPDLKALFSRLLRDEAAQLRKLPPNRIPVIHGIVDGGGAVPCLLTDYYPDSLLERLRKGMDFAQFCDALARTCRALEVIHATGQTHGNLKPGNIFFVPSEDGTTQVRFTDPLTPLYHRSLDRLSVRDSSVPGWLPPECLSSDVQLPLPRNADAFAIGKLFFEAIVHPENLTASFSGKGGPFIGPIDKGKLNQFRAALAQRLQEGKSNPHVRELLIKRATSFLARALSKEPDPSPPYRFCSIAEMANRLEELRGLFHPGFQQMGSLISGSQHADGGFYAGEEIRFSISFRCHGGIDDIDLITCMTYVRDLVAEQKVRDSGVLVYPSHDGHRFRFSFRIPRLDPGHYLVRVALAIKGSPGKPVHRDLTFTVHEEEAEVSPDGWTSKTVATGKPPSHQVEDKLNVDVIPPDLLQDWRTEPEQRKSAPPSSPSGTPASTSADGAGRNASRPARKPAARTSSEDASKTRKAILWTQDGEGSSQDRRVSPSDTVHPMDDKPARIIVRPERTDGEARSPGDTRRQPARESHRAAAHDRTGETRRDGSRGPDSEKPPKRDIQPRGGGRKGRPRAPLEAVAVGRDAVRHAREDERAPEKSREAVRQVARKDERASAKPRDRVRKSSHRSTHDPSVQRPSSHKKRTEDNDQAAIPDAGTEGAGLRGRGYYEKARAVPGARDDPDAFFRKGALKTQQRVIVVGALSVATVLIIALVILIFF